MNYKNIGSCVLFTGFFGLSLCSASCEDDDKENKKKTKKETVDQFYKHMCDLGLMKEKVNDKKEITYEIVPGAKEAIARLLEKSKYESTQTPADLNAKDPMFTWGEDPKEKIPVVNGIKQKA